MNYLVSVVARKLFSEHPLKQLKEYMRLFIIVSHAQT
jgi:hypothetical protein